MGALQTSQAELEAFYAKALPGFLEYLKTHGTAVGSIELAESLEGITSLPARFSLGGVEKVVLAPLKLLTKDVDTRIDACEAATAAAHTAASAANAAAKKVTDAITDIGAEKQAALDAASAANGAATAATQAKGTCDDAARACREATELCQTQTTACAAATTACRNATEECINETANSRAATVEAKNAATQAKGTCDDAARACREATELCQTQTTACAAATTACRNATEECINETANSRAATVEAKNAATQAKGEAGNLSALKTACQDVTTRCDSTNSTAEEKIAEMASLLKSLSAEANASPVRMEVSAPETISTRNKTGQRIDVRLFPGYVMKNVLFQRVSGSSLAADPSGNLKVTGTGLTSFHVIPTQNTELWEQADISVRGPLIRRTSGGKIRLNRNQMRII